VPRPITMTNAPSPSPAGNSPRRSGPRTLVTAGPTHEPIDRVRFLGNRSSGRLGLAIAEAAARRGCPTTLLLGPVESPPSPPIPQLELLRFRTAADLERLLREHAPECDLIVMAAAVADFRPRSLHDGKHRRTDEGLTLELEAVPDLLAGLASRRRSGQRIVGFALEEASDLEDRAVAKLRRKAIDAIVANPLETMDAREVRGLLFFADGRRETPPGHPEAIAKEAFASWLVDRLLADDWTSVHAEI
jgi:phosphopantothenoylcysteine decarboxylase/phosphopantothenate--cysteine ligase